MTDIIELTAEEKLQMNDVVGELHIQLEKLRSMIMKPFEFPETDMSELVELIKAYLDDRIVSPISEIGYERHRKKFAVSENKFDRKSRRTRKRHNSL